MLVESRKISQHLKDFLLIIEYNHNKLKVKV